MKKHIEIIFLLGTLAVILAGCGSGGGGGSTPAGGTTSTQTVVTISTEATGAVSALPIIGMEVTLTLPAGVTVSADAAGLTNSGVIVATGVAAGASTVGNYTAATATTPATVRLIVIKSTGFGVGETVTVTCNHNNSPVNASGFSLSGFKPVDNLGITITGLAPTFTVR